MLTKTQEALRSKSIQVILENQFASGAYIASPTFKVYNYSWFRDGAFIADAMLDAGETESARRFHIWVANVIAQRASQIKSLIRRSELGETISPEEHLHCRYTIEGETSAEEWTNFQLDGFGIWIWSLGRFVSETGAIPEESLSAVHLLTDYLLEFWDSPSYDWWEESFGYLHVSSLGSILAGLRAAQDLPLGQGKSPEALDQGILHIEQTILSEGLTEQGGLSKWLGSQDVDGSLAALIHPLGVIPADSEYASKTLSSIEIELGRLGTHRHKHDVYFGGGKWVILSAFLALAHAKRGDVEIAEDILDWILNSADDQLHLPEQVADGLLHPEHLDPWIQKWGESAKPLLWSHAMFLKLHSSLNKDSE